MINRKLNGDVSNTRDSIRRLFLGSRLRIKISYIKIQYGAKKKKNSEEITNNLRSPYRVGGEGAPHSAEKFRSYERLEQATKVVTDRVKTRRGPNANVRKTQIVTNSIRKRIRFYRAGVRNNTVAVYG